MSFASDIGKFTKKFNGTSEKVFRGVALQLFSRVILRSPVGNPDLWKSKAPPGYVGGRFRANWQASINTPPSGEVDDIDKSGSQALSKAKSVINKARLGDGVYFINNLPYGQELEDGHSSQAPHGMVKTTVAEYDKIVEAQARRHKK